MYLQLERNNSANIYDDLDGNQYRDFSNRQLIKRMNIGEGFTSKTEVDEITRRTRE